MALINPIGAGKPASVAFGATGNSSFTAYSTLCSGTSSTSAWQTVGTGTTGQVLKSTGTSSLPTWQAGAGQDALVLIQTQTVSDVASVDFTTGINNSTYTKYFITISNYYPKNAVSDDLLMRVSDDGGGTYYSTGYTSGISFYAANSTTLQAGTNGTGFYIMGSQVYTSGFPTSTAQLWFTNVATSGNRCVLIGTANATFSNVPNITSVFGVGPNGSGTAGVITALRFIAVNANIYSGTFSLYGVSQ